MTDRFISTPRLSKCLFGKAQSLISPSGYLAEAFQRYGYDVTVIPNNIEIDRYIFRQRSRVKPRLLYVRALETLYNPAMAIKVLAQLRSETGEGELCFVGPDKDNSTPQLKDLAHSLGVSSYIKYTGKLSKQQWTSLSVDYDIFINPTHADNMPVSVIEAMALGLPVVSTNVGGLPYIIKDGFNGLLVNDDDVAAMTKAILRLCTQPALAAGVSKEGRMYAEQFDWKIVRRKWERVLLAMKK